ncbi:MAG: hypothetical protein AB7G88_00865 [Thermomicrobiales bacterium]
MEYVKSLADEYKPWRKGLSWWVLAAQGALAVLVGIYFLAAPDSANSTIRFLLAALLIISSAVDIRAGFAGFHQQMFAPQPMAPYLLVRGGAGVALGIAYFVSTRSDYMTEGNARYLLGFGMIAYAIVGLIAAGVSIFRGDFKMASLLANVLFLAIGAVLIYNNRDAVGATDAVQYLGIAALLGGAALLVYSWFLKQDQEAAALAGPPPAIDLTDGLAAPPLVDIETATGESMPAPGSSASAEAFADHVTTATPARVLETP